MAAQSTTSHNSALAEAYASEAYAHQTRDADSSTQNQSDDAATNVAQHVREHFLAAVSHELRTPLTALTGYGELLADEILGPLSSLQQETIGRMRSATHQLTVMIDGILAFANIEAGVERTVTSEVSPVGVVRDVAVIVEPMAHTQGIELVVEVPADVAALHTDREKVKQILLHLTENAIKFSKSGSVRLRCRNMGNEVHFDVVDTGIGIASENLTRIFHPFVQVDSGLTRRHGGIGLGLYIADRFARLLDGRIEVESAPGAGSAFSLVIPRSGSR
jgi:signal transduction histidine kinase